MLTPEENERITGVGPGTPGGDLFRRYWHPVAAASELTPERPLKRLKILGEELVLYRTEAGDYGLLGEHVWPILEVRLGQGARLEVQRLHTRSSRSASRSACERPRPRIGAGAGHSPSSWVPR